jgi:hypothetical protein
MGRRWEGRGKAVAEAEMLKATAYQKGKKERALKSHTAIAMPQWYRIRYV